MMQDNFSITRWTPFMTPREQLKILDHILVTIGSNAVEGRVYSLLIGIIDYLGKLLDTPDITIELYRRIPRLLGVGTQSQHKAKIEQFIFRCLSSNIPYGLLPSVQQLRPNPSGKWINSIENQWTISRMKVPEDVSRMLDNLTFDSLDDLQLVSPLLYGSSKLRQLFSAFVESCKPTRLSSFIALRILLEGSSKQDDYLPAINTRFAYAITKSVLTSSDATERELSQTCMLRMLEICEKEQLYAALKKYAADIHDNEPLPFLGALAQSDLLSSAVANTLLLSLLRHITSLLSNDYPKEDNDKLLMHAVGKCGIRSHGCVQLNFALGRLADKCNNIPALDVITICNLCAREHLSQPEVNDALVSIIKSSSLRVRI